jgi:hypothetical protein
MGTRRMSSSLRNKNRHPLHDIFNWKLPVYGDEADELIRKIGALSSGQETIEWWEKKIGWVAAPEEALFQAKIRYEDVLKKARESGWEFSE